MKRSQLVDANPKHTDADRSWQFDALEILQATQKKDCLYLSCQGNLPHKILHTIAPDRVSAMQAGGIEHIKLLGKAWALGVDLPIGDAELMAAAIAQYLLSDGRVNGIAIKVLLKHSHLHILCEKATEISKALMALPIVEALRQAQPGDHLLGVSVYGRIENEASNTWKFDVNPAALGIRPTAKQPPIQSGISSTAPPTQSTATSIDRAKTTTKTDVKARTKVVRSPEARTDGANAAAKTDVKARTKVVRSPEAQSCKKSSHNFTPIYQAIQNLLQLKWLGSTNVKPLEGGIVTGIASVALGIALIVAIDRSLSALNPKNTSSKNLESQSTEMAGSSSSSNRDRTKLIADYNNPFLNQKLILIESYMASLGRSPDVIIVGSSRALRGIDPHTMEQTLAQRGYKGINIFNMGINGATAQVVNLQVARILTSQQLPKLIIWADGVRAFNSNREDETFDAIARSSSYAQLQQSAQQGGQNGSHAKLSSASPLGLAVMQTLSNLLPNYANREQIRASLVLGYSRLTDRLTNSEALTATTATDNALQMDDKGFVSVDIHFDPQTYFRTYPKVYGDYDLDYRNFDMNGKQMDALNALAGFCDRHNIKLIFVNMPMHASYLDGSRMRYEKIFKQRMLEMSKTWGLTYIDFSTIWRNQPKYFSDPSHLNHWGAIAIASKLATNPKVPWNLLR
jgi:hypothetical protein